jgi:hypothetical protein
MNPPSKPIVFVTGASRSGTTLLCFILGRSAQICPLSETHYFGEIWDPRSTPETATSEALVRAAANLFARLKRGILDATVTEEDIAEARSFLTNLPVEQHNLRDIYMSVMGHFATKKGKTVPCEQTPRNIFYARRLLEIFPEARVVHMIRDPRAVMASQKKRWQRRKLAAAKLPFYHTIRVWANYHPYTMGQLWKRATSSALALQRDSHPRFKTVRFEDLLQEPETTVRDLCAFLQIPYQAQMLEVKQINSSHQSSVGGARPGLNKAAIDAWQKVLRPGEAAITEATCGEQMERCGYTRLHRGGPGIVTRLRYGVTYLFHAASVAATNPRRALVQFKAAFRGGVPRS